MPAAYDPADPSAYVEGVLALVGDRDPEALLAGAPERLAVAVSGLTEENAHRPEAPGTWSVVEVLRHLADSEIVYGYRMRTIVAAGDAVPPIPGYDQDAWAAQLHYAEGTVAEALEDHAAARRTTLRWLARLSPGERERAGLHSERGPESVERMVRLLAGHDLNHENQIRRVRAALGA